MTDNHVVHPDTDLIQIIPADNHSSTDSGREDDELLFFDKHSNYIVESKFDRSKSAISLLGAFNVHDKNGDDITNKFTDRLKSLLILALCRQIAIAVKQAASISNSTA